MTCDDALEGRNNCKNYGSKSAMHLTQHREVIPYLPCFWLNETYVCTCSHILRMNIHEERRNIVGSTVELPGLNKDDVMFTTTASLCPAK